MTQHHQHTVSKVKLCHVFINSNAESPQNLKELEPCIEHDQNRLYTARAYLCKMQHSDTRFSEKSAYLDAVQYYKLR